MPKAQLRTTNRVRPRILGRSAPDVATKQTTGRMRTMGKLLGGAPRQVPAELSSGAEGARKRMMLSARSKAAKLDIMAKRRTDEGER